MMAITARVRNSGVARRHASGNSGRVKRRKPYVPIFSSTPARMTEPPVGASVWASGSQVCSGKIGTLIANASAKAANSSICGECQNPWRIGTESPSMSHRSNDHVPVCACDTECSGR